MSEGDKDRITTLERRCRLLLRLYPVAYRAERGDEIGPADTDMTR